MGRSLSQGFGDNGGLTELDAETEMDDRVQEAGEHAHEHVIGPLVAGEDIFVYDVFVAPGADLLLKEDEVVVVIALVSEVLFELRGVLEVLNYGIVDRFRSTLVGCIAVILGLEDLRRGAESEKGENMMDDVVLRDC